MNIPKDLLYTKSHEWVKETSESTAQVGLSDYAQHELGDLVFVNLPAAGDAVTAGEAFGDVESVKAVSDVYSPVSGTVAAVNEQLMDEPALINEDAYAAWLMEVEDISARAELMSAEDYEKFISEGA